MFEDSVFIVIWLALPFFWHFLLKTAGLSLWRLTIPSFLILFFYVFQYIGLPISYFYLDEFRASTVNHQWLMAQVFFYTAITMTLMMFGFIAGRTVFGPLKWVGAADIRESGKVQILGVIIYFTVCLVVLVLYILKVGIDKVALLVVSGLGDDITAQVARSAMGNAFEGNFHWYYLFMKDLILFSAYVFFAQYLLRPNFKNRLLFGVVFTICTFSMIMATEKAPMADFLIALFVTYVLVKKSGEVSFNGVIPLFVALVSVLTLFYIYFVGSQGPLQAILLMVSRVLTGQLDSAYYYLQYFPKQHDFLLGRSFPNPSGIFPFKVFELTKELMVWYHPELANIGVVGSMPAAYWGEMYANFGFIGVLLPPFFVGLFLYWINRLIFRLSPDPLTIALFVWFMMHYKSLYGSSLSSYFLDNFALVALFFFFLISFISSKGRLKLRRIRLCKIISLKS